MRQILIVANQTVGSEALAGVVRTFMAAEPCRFVLLVPATEPKDFESAVMAMAATVDAIPAGPRADPYKVARGRLRDGLGWLHNLGAVAEGEVGDRNPMHAIRASLRREGRQFDEIIISTLPRRVSRWLMFDLPRRAKRSVFPSRLSPRSP